MTIHPVGTEEERREVAARPGRDRGPAEDLSLADCRASGCDHLECRRAERAHSRLTPPVPAAGSRRRLRALAWNGWSPAELARRLGEPARVVRRLQSGSPCDVPADVAARISWLYDLLWDVTGNSPRTAAAARRHSFAPALAWDDDQPGSEWDTGHCIDDPDAAPAPGWYRHPVRSALDDAARAAELADLVRQGMTLNRAALRLGISGAALRRLRDLVAVAS